MTHQWESQLEELCRERAGGLVARARMLVASDAEAQDLVQEALIATFSKRRGFTNTAQAEQYVRKAIVSRFIDTHRKKSRESELWLRVVPSSSGADHSAKVVSAVDIDSLLQDLPPRVRACIVLRYLEDLSISQTAARLELSEGAVKRYVSDGLAALNAALGTRASVDDPHEHVPLSYAQGGRS